jgi:DNA-binding transcriptional regulator YiaG
MKPTTTKKVTFQVQIPNLDGDGIADSVPIEVQVYADPETGEEVLTQESLELIEKTQARYMGLLSAEEIKELRRRLDVTQHEISELLQVGEKTYTRWENGRSRPSRSMNLLLCALRDGWINVNYLRFLREPNLKEEWFSRIPDPKDVLTNLAQYTIKLSDDLRFESDSNFQRWFAWRRALVSALSSKAGDRQRIFISHQGERIPMMAAKIAGPQPKFHGGSRWTQDLGHQTRIPEPICPEAEEAQFG